MEFISKHVLACFLILFMPLVLSSCLLMPTVPMQVHIEAAKQLNPDVSSAPLPVRLKIYQLRDATAFNEATFRQLWKSDVEVLGSALVDKKELTMIPGETQTIRLSRHTDVEFIAVVAVFRRYEDNTWRAIKRLPGKMTTWSDSLNIQVKSFRVEIA